MAGAGQLQAHQRKRLEFAQRGAGSVERSWRTKPRATTSGGSVPSGGAPEGAAHRSRGLPPIRRRGRRGTRARGDDRSRGIARYQRSRARSSCAPTSLRTWCRAGLRAKHAASTRASGRNFPFGIRQPLDRIRSARGPRSGIDAGQRRLPLPSSESTRSGWTAPVTHTLTSRISPVATARSMPRSTPSPMPKSSALNTTSRTSPSDPP